MSAQQRAAQKSREASAQQLLQQQLLGCLRSPWKSVVVVPAQPGGAASSIADALANVAWLVRGKEAKVFSVEGMDVAGASKVIMDVDAHVAAGGLAVTIIEPVVSRQAGIPVALAADGVVLCVELGVATIDDAKRTVELIGPQKFLGAVTIERGAGAA